ncbi:HPC2-domain-containing protein [Xylariaceae sp. AK1471]|nr:HPC2-domain-containing protein [Xylariaceae sp. AK1471]
MAAASGNPMRYSSSPELSDPPSMLSAPTSPTGFGRPKPNGGELDEIVVDPTTIRYDGSGQPLLTKDGLPRRKPGPKPGSRIKRNSTNPEEAVEKPKRSRKPRDPNAPPSQRRRKVTAPLDGENADSPSRAASSPAGTGTSGPMSRQPKITEMATTLGRLEPIPQPQREPKRESMPGSMSSILNAEPEPQQSYHQQQPLQQQQPPQQQPQQPPQPPPRPSVTPRASGTAYDPIRSSNYDPVRETMISHTYPNTMGSPRGPTTTNAINRASASPSIASLVDPPLQNIISPVPSHTTFAPNQQQNQPQPQPQSRPHQDSSSVPASPNPFRRDFAPPPAPKPSTLETKKPTMPLSTLAASKIEVRPTSITTIGAAGAKRAASKNYSATSSSPRIPPAKDSLDPLPGRSILDFGRAEPGSELVVPSIILNIPLNGETNKYVNFMRMAEEQYGWEALHPRQAEHKARKARIAAASAALAQNDSSREGDEMSVDESDNDDSNIEMGGTSGPDKPADGKPAKKKRHFKEDQYDRDDDFVDDSELLWEEQAAASRDGFFVYSGPLVREVEKPEPGRGDGLPKRGRGSRGGRGGSRGAATGTGRGRGGGPGSRGGITRKPRMTKADKAQLDREKAEREANFLKSSTASSYNVLQPSSPKFAGL